METLIFEPQQAGLDSTFWAGLLIGLLALSVTLYLTLSKHPGITSAQRQVGSLLAFIVFLVALGTTVFSGWASIRIQAVELSPTTIKTPYGTVEYEQIRRFYIEPRYERSFVNPNMATDTTYFLVIEELNGRGHILSDENYPIGEIARKLEEQQ